MNGPVPLEQLEHLDLSTFLEVSQVLSGEIVLERLIDTLMRRGLEHSGARRGVLVLPFGAGWQVAAEAIAGVDGVAVRTPAPPPCPGSLPQSLLDHVVRTRERVVVDDASVPGALPGGVDFGHKRVRSVLCLPLLKGGELIAVLYLENDLVPGAFTPARRALLALLASQAAIALENGRLCRELREREEKTRRLVDASFIGIVMVDTSDPALRVVDANDAFLAMLGYSRADLKAGLSLPGLTPPEWMPLTRRQIAQVSAAGSCEVYEKEYLRKDGARIPVLIGCAAIDGSTAGAFVVDLTERKRAEEALRLSNAYNRSLIEASLDPLVTIGPDGKITDVNAATETATGRSRVDLVGTDFCDYFTAPATARAGYQRAFREGTVRDYPLDLRHRDGTVISVLYNASVYRDASGRVIGVFAAARDLTERKKAEQQAARLAAIVESSDDAILSKTRDNVIASWNKGAEKTYGYTAEEAIGRPASLLTDPGRPDETPELLARVLRGERVEHYETVRRRKDGELITVSLTLSPVRDPWGRIVGASAIARDISERKRAEEALRQSEADLKRAQEVAHIGSWYLDVAANRLTWSDEVFRIFGVPPGASLTYEAFLERVYPEDRGAVDSAWSSALQGAPYEIDHRIVVGDALKWVRERAELKFDDHGNPITGLGTVQDITERKRAEEERRESAERFRAIADYTYDWESWTGIDGTLLWLNPAVERITGYSVDECMAMPDFPIPIVAEADRETVARQMEEAVRGSSRNDFEFRVRHKDGHLAWVAASWQPIYDSGGVRLGHRSSIRDIAERKRAEEALRRSEEERRRAEIAAQRARAELEQVSRLTALGELAASIGHEVNQPLAAVVTSANAGLNWLAGEPPNLAKAREAFGRVVRDGTRAGEVLSRIRAALRRTPSVRHPVDLNRALQEVLALMTDELQQRDVALSLALDPAAPAVLGDLVQLQQVFLNLVRNAIEAMADVEDRPRTLRIESGPADLDGNPAAMIAVSDSGPGLGPAEATLFQAFQTTKPQGMGMGLWISRSIAEGHRGRLSGRSNDGPGATFRLLLPAANGGAE